MLLCTLGMPLDRLPTVPQDNGSGANDPTMRDTIRSGEGRIQLRQLRLAAICLIVGPSNGTRIGGCTSVCVWSLLMISVAVREVLPISCGMLSTSLHMVVRTASMLPPIFKALPSSN